MLTCIFIFKDGFTGQSPGKRLTKMMAIDVASGQPVGFGQSFKRNAVFLWGQIPFIGPLVGIIINIVIAVQVAAGYRLGDKSARTRVIWTTYRHLPVFGGNALQCDACGYDLQGNQSGVCPECGKELSEHNRAMLAALWQAKPAGIS